MAGIPGYANTLVREFELPRLGTLGLRMRVWLASGRLTQQLAAGTSPVASRELALRAGQITDRRSRELLGASISDLVEHAQRQTPIYSARVPVDRPKVVLARVPLLELAERLRSSEPVTPRGMALVLLLLSDPAQSLYGTGGAVDLARDVIEARQVLDGLPESRLDL